MTDTEITRLAATAVMGWPAFGLQDTGYSEAPRPKLIENVSHIWIAHYPDRACAIWHPLADWRAAGEIVEKMRADGWFPGVEAGPKLIDGKWARVVRVRWGKNKQFGAFTSPDFPRAITIAAALAVGAVTEAQLAESAAPGDGSSEGKAQ